MARAYGEGEAACKCALVFPPPQGGGYHAPQAREREGYPYNVREDSPSPWRFAPVPLP